MRRAQEVRQKKKKEKKKQQNEGRVVTAHCGRMWIEFKTRKELLLLNLQRIKKFKKYY